MRSVFLGERTLRHAYCGNSVSSPPDPSPFLATHLVEVRSRKHSSGVVELREESSQACALESLEPAEPPVVSTGACRENGTDAPLDQVRTVDPEFVAAVSAVVMSVDFLLELAKGKFVREGRQDRVEDFVFCGKR